MRKIHRDIKAGNILLLNSGTAKLADFGVAGQLSDTLAKRNTVIGTPYWMAPEVIQEIGYNYSADIWSLGITAIEMADGKPPLADIHPMRALFMIPSQPSPALRKPSAWSTEFRAFVSSCLAKTPESRPTAAALLQTEFIRNAKSCSILLPLIDEANAARERRIAESKAAMLATNEISVTGAEAVAAPVAGAAKSQRPASIEELDEGNGTMVRQNRMNNSGEGKHDSEMDGGATMVSSGSRRNKSGVSRRTSTAQTSLSSTNSDSPDNEDLGTMVINPSEDEGEGGEEEDSGSVVVHDTRELDEHERAQREAFDHLDAALGGLGGACSGSNVGGGLVAAEGTLTRRANGAMRGEPESCQPPGVAGVVPPPPIAQRPFAPFSRALQQSGLFPGGMANEPGALNRLTYPQLQELLAKLTGDLETELRNLAVRYRHKRQPLLDAIAEKTAQAAAEVKISMNNAESGRSADSSYQTCNKTSA
ncbi:Serine:threonine protein kinase 3 [Fasciola gigantica]|uniref:Serine:threonine protein kinase 3 n=1 Tax=Fasciola gigantica TaxID=46835 RepID=A0A504YED5_FASGI|nr:Serine:threonine protein kinase 3 [Fasciola gigantica]